VRNLKFVAVIVRDILGRLKNYKIGSRDPHMTPFDAILHFFPLDLTALRLPVKFEVASFNRLRDIRGSKNSKSGSRDSDMNPFDKTLHYLSLELTAFRLRAKFEVSSFSRWRDMDGPKIAKLVHVTPT